MTDSTLTEDGKRAVGPRACCQLYLGLECERPLARSSRHALVEIDEVILARGTRRDAVRADRTLTVSIPDRWMSGAHARMLKVMGRWVIEDTASKNGLRINSETVTKVTLEDGDVIEVGHSFLVFRDAEVQGVKDLDASALSSTGLRTLLPGYSERIRDLVAVAKSMVPVTIYGETGTGKELAARAVHALSARSGAFIAVNCGGLTSTILESELMGHLKGSFSSATEDRPGLVRASDKGTLFLDEIADLPLAAQPMLLRVLQEKEVTPVGATRPVKVDLRIVCASHGALPELAAQNRFRPDLLARLSGFTLSLPSLRERVAELGLILGDLLQKLAPDRASRVSFTLEAGRALMLHEWPLNVRELEHALEAALAISPDGEIDLAQLSKALQEPREDSAPLAEPLSAESVAHRDELIALFIAHQGNASAVARALNKGRNQVNRWIKRYGIDPRAYVPR